MLNAEPGSLSEPARLQKLRGASSDIKSTGETAALMLPVKEDSVTAVEVRRMSLPCEVVRGRGWGSGSVKFSLESEGSDAVNGRKDCVDSLRTQSRGEPQTFYASPRPRSRPEATAVPPPDCLFAAGALFQDRYVWSPSFLGLIKCVTVKITPSTIHIPPTTI